MDRGFYKLVEPLPILGNSIPANHHPNQPLPVSAGHHRHRGQGDGILQDWHVIAMVMAAVSGQPRWLKQFPDSFVIDVKGFDYPA